MPRVCLSFEQHPLALNPTMTPEWLEQRRPAMLPRMSEVHFGNVAGESAAGVFGEEWIAAANARGREYELSNPVTRDERRRLRERYGLLVMAAGLDRAMALRAGSDRTVLAVVGRPMSGFRIGTAPVFAPRGSPSVSCLRRDRRGGRLCGLRRDHPQPPQHLAPHAPARGRTRGSGDRPTVRQDGSPPSNGRDPLASALALAPGDGQDGLLRAWEIMEQVRLHADLVVLSACRSGLGETTRHEGTIGLTRAFQYAGARRVVVTLWDVSDDSTEALVQLFYGALRRGALAGIPLRYAMQTTRRERRWQHPRYWAAFVLVGD